MFYLQKVLQFLQYDIYFLISLFFLIIITIVYLKVRHTPPDGEAEMSDIRYLTLVFLVTIFVFILWSVFLSYKQYLVWQAHPFSKYLLPPYQKINYYLDYAYFHFWRDLVYRLIGVLIVFLLMKFISFVFKRDVFYDDEKILVPYLSLFFFFPYNILFFFLGLFMLNLIIAVSGIRNQLSGSSFRLSEIRFSFKDYWLWLAWLMLILAPFILNNYKFLEYKP